MCHEIICIGLFTIIMKKRLMLILRNRESTKQNCFWQRQTCLFMGLRKKLALRITHIFANYLKSGQDFLRQNTDQQTGLVNRKLWAVGICNHILPKLRFEPIDFARKIYLHKYITTQNKCLQVCIEIFKRETVGQKLVKSKWWFLNCVK